MSRPIVTVTKLFAGARTIVVLVEALPDQVGAEPRCRLEGDRGAERPKVATVDVILGRSVRVIAAALGHRTRDAAGKHVLYQRHVEHGEQTAAGVVESGRASGRRRVCK